MSSRLQAYVGQKAQEPGAHDARLTVQQPSAVMSLSFVKEG
jgi:hypothetical protein